MGPQYNATTAGQRGRDVTAANNPAKMTLLRPHRGIVILGWSVSRLLLCTVLRGDSSRPGMFLSHREAPEAANAFLDHYPTAKEGHRGIIG